MEKEMTEQYRLEDMRNIGIMAHIDAGRLSPRELAEIDAFFARQAA
jgi:translation elongation factor EF-G